MIEIRSGRKLHATGASLFAMLLYPAIAQAQPHPVVPTESGPVRGIETSTERQFLGIRYAAAPVGDLRWKPPQPPPRHHGVAGADAFGSSCPQVASPFGIASVDEDCLFLNVFAPLRGHRGDSESGADDDHRGSKRRPVMVWIHGGAFQLGESSDFDPHQLVAQGAVVVTINYRLGALGFLAHPALTAESGGSSGDYGLMDQQAALRWVQRNIAGFDGDPDDVTIFGQSAGGLSVHAQLVSPGSTGLFHRAIVQSGAYSLTQPTLAGAEAEGSAFAAAVGCTGQDAACLRSVPVATLLAHQNPSPAAYIPNVDGNVLPMSIGPAFSAGQFHRVPVIEGSNHDEYRLFVALLFELQGNPVTPANYPAAIAAALGVPPQIVPFIVAQYPLSAYPSASVALGAVGTDAAFACNALLSANLLSQYVPTWQYEFDDPNAPQRFLPPVSFPYGAYHGAEIQYLMDLRVTVPAPPLTADQQMLSSAMVRYWSAFARAGDPNTGATPFWVSHAGGIVGGVQALLPPQPSGSNGIAFAIDHQCAFWAALQSLQPAQ